MTAIKKCHAMVHLSEVGLDNPYLTSNGPYIIDFATPEDGNQALLKLHAEGGDGEIHLELRTHVPTGTTHTTKGENGREWEVPDVRIDQDFIIVPSREISHFEEVVA